MGPVDAGVSRLWIGASQDILRVLRRNRFAAPVAVEVPLLDLAEIYLAIWSDVAHEDRPFEWTSTLPVEVVIDIAELWRIITSMTDSDLQRLGAEWPPEASRPFFDALLAGVVGALSQDPRTQELARDLSERPPGTEF